MKQLLAGLDAGSTTVKLVILDEDGSVLYKRYERHLSLVREKSTELLREAAEVLKGREFKLLVTGSAGLGLARACGLGFVQEVYATARAVEVMLPGTDAVVELGGEDAKIIFFGGGLEQRMNGSCAGGTGAFIDQMATLLDTTPDDLDKLALKAQKIYPIASRCGVFAKSDLQPLLNQGAAKEDLAASIFQAVVSQTIAGLAQGRRIEGKVAFLGGPLSFFESLRSAFVKTLGLTGDNAQFPEDARFFVGIGAALCAETEEEAALALTAKGYIARLEAPTGQRVAAGIMRPLFSSQAEYDAFSERHGRNTPETFDIEKYTGDAFLGIDSGSTTTKIVLITEDGRLLHSYYGSNLGSPLTVVREQLLRLYALCGTRVNIRGTAVTGYGEDLIKAAFGMDIGLVETMAHYRAARFFCPEVDFILDIGGQDMKCFRIKNGAVDSIMLNEACSSGCGSFLESFARALGYGISDFASLGLFAKGPVDLGSRCTVFMNSSVKQAQKEGAGVDDISAGLSASVVKNALYKVIRLASPRDMGRHIVVQGGTFLNDAVLRAFEQETELRVIRPGIAGLMGAFGAALSAAQAIPETTRLISKDELLDFSFTSKESRCGLCPNNCPLRIIRFGNGGSFLSGNRCERAGKKSSERELPNLVRYKYEKLRKMTYDGGAKGTIGLPFVLNICETLPFWREFFAELSYNVVLSDESNRRLYEKGQHTIPSDTVCYPAKLAHGHITCLIEKKVDYIFYPCMPYNLCERETADNHFNCPVVAYYPELIHANVGELSNVRYLQPYFGLHRPKDFVKRAAKYFGETLGATKAEVKRAAARAYDAYYAYLEDIRAEGTRAVEYARANDMKIIILAGRPYHVDPEINHGIDRLVSSYKLVVVTEDAVAHLARDESVKVLNQWMYHSRLYNAARYAVDNSDTELVQLVSFGCGLDAITTDEVRDILEKNGKLYTQLKIDEIDNLGAVKIRLRSMLAAIDARDGAKESAEAEDERVPVMAGS